MAAKATVSSPICAFYPDDVEGIDSLVELALDMRWSWNHAADEIWQQLDPRLWDLTQNPWVVLQTVSHDQLRSVLAKQDFRKKVDNLLQARRSAVESPGWFQQHHSDAPLECAAYFCMEFMLSEGLPIYSGGLGNVAGDQLKAASDLGVPIVGLGLLYQQGYFRQVIDRDGGQQALFPYNDPGQLPITPLREPSGEWLRIELSLPGYSLWLRTWQVQVGRVRLFLLDSNDPANFPAHRGITSELYGGGQELRLKQELVLGIGGWRLLGAMGMRPEVCHLNEGHAAFAVLERARSFMEETGEPFEVALAATRPGNLFTTHTPVPAGFDRFAPSLMEQYLAGYATNLLGISIDDLLALGRQNPSDSQEPFNMAYLAMRGSGAVNGVSRLHGRVSRRIFQVLFPRWPEHEVPVGYVTNGVHMASWDSEHADELWTVACAKDRWREPTELLEEQMHLVADEEFWQLRAAARKSLIEYVRKRLSLQLAMSGATSYDCEHAHHVFDENALTLGFARRFAAYKRPNLLLQDTERLMRILTNSQHPVQIIIAGKAHPADQTGQAMVREWIKFIRQSGVRDHIVFLSDYDVFLTERLVQGVDVWLNTPRRPWEACGTSGMKVLVNGGLNLSELDGWWAEAYTPEVGWAIGDGQEHGDDPDWDAAEAEQLYSLLENEVIPEFYTRDPDGIPRAWVTRMRASMSRLTPRYSADRTVREYTEKYYIPAAKACLRRKANKGSLAKQIFTWQNNLRQHWSSLHFGEMKVSDDQGDYSFELQLYFSGIAAEDLRVELYADAIDDSEPERREMMRGRQLVGASGFVYTARFHSSRPITDFTARVIPRNPDAAVPLEASQILWQS